MQRGAARDDASVQGVHGRHGHDDRRVCVVLYCRSMFMVRSNDVRCRRAERARYEKRCFVGFLHKTTSLSAHNDDIEQIDDKIRFVRA